MEKVFSTQIVFGDTSGKVAIKPVQVRLQPGQPLIIPSTEKILLSGGFQTLSPQSPHLVSPTLQLQSDNPTFPDEELLLVAEAEVERLRSTPCNSYQVDADPRICVVADNAEQLDDFVDTYGGVLDIYPLLFGEVTPDHSVITKIDVARGKDGISICFRKRSPLIAEKCTYCGACGPVCPEKCISALLDIDFTRCTLCGECEKICEQNAIDIHGVEEIGLHFPALFLLGNVKLDLPDNKDGIYRQEQLSDFFRSVFPVEINEVVCHNNSICQYSGRLDSGCTRCIDSCPSNALGRSEKGIRIDHHLCTNCGSCVAKCPTGAMQNGHFRDETLLRYMERLQGGCGRDLIIGESDDLHKIWWAGMGNIKQPAFFLEYPSVRTLSFMHFLLFFSRGFGRITVLQKTSLQADSTLQTQIDKANAIISSLFDIDGCVETALPEEYSSQEREEGWSHPIKTPFQAGAFKNRRILLTGILQHLIAISGKGFDCEETATDFLNLTCDTKKCTQCLACINECKTRALRVKEEDYSLTYHAGLCVGCGICVTVCPEKVLCLSETGLIDERFFQVQLFAESEPARCKGCGKIFGSKKSLDRVLQILASREAINSEHFQYCSECRVIQLFEEHQS